MNRKLLLSKGLFSLLSLAMFMACQQEELVNNQQIFEPSEGIHVPINLSVIMGGVTRAALLEEEGTRAVSTPTGDPVMLTVVVGDAKSKAKKDDGTVSFDANKQATLDGKMLIKEQPQIKMLLLLRKKGDKRVAYNYKTWTYNPTKKVYQLRNEEVILPEGATIQDEIEGRLFAGGYYDETAHAMKIPAGLGQVVDLKHPNITLPIPFASSWVTMNKDAFNINYIKDTNHVFQLYPVGVLMTTTFRNTSSEDLSIKGIDVQSNTLNFGEIAFNLTDGNVGDNAKTTIPAYTVSATTPLAAGQLPSDKEVGVYTMPEVEDTYYRFQINDEDGNTISIPHQAKNTYNISNDKVVVFWGMPVAGKKHGNSYAGATEKNFFTYAQTHVYARGVTNSEGKIISKPNYDIVPIMGSDVALQNGYAYTMNAELFDQPNVILGYFAKYTVKASGEEFLKSHDRTQVDYVSYRVARDFVNGKELTNTDGVKSKFYLPTITSLTLLVQNAGPVLKPNTSGTFAAGRIDICSGDNSQTCKYQSQAWASGVRKEVGGVAHDQDGKIDFGPVDYNANNYNFGRYYAYNKEEVNLAYGITNKSKTYGAGLKRTQQADQTLWRYELIPVQDELLGTSKPLKANTGKIYQIYERGVGEDLDIQALFVGKFFVGNAFSPIYKGANLLDEVNLWKNQEARKNLVERYVPARGIITNVDGKYNAKYESILQDESIDAPTIDKDAYTPAISLWSIANGYTTARLMYWWQQKMHKDKTAMELIDLLFKEAPYIYDKTGKKWTDKQKYDSEGDGNGFYKFPTDIFAYRWRDLPFNKDWRGNGSSFGSFSASNYKSRAMPMMFLPLLPWSATYQGDEKD